MNNKQNKQTVTAATVIEEKARRYRAYAFQQRKAADPEKVRRKNREYVYNYQARQFDRLVQEGILEPIEAEEPKNGD